MTQPQPRTPLLKFTLAQAYRQPTRRPKGPPPHPPPETHQHGRASRPQLVVLFHQDRRGRGATTADPFHRAVHSRLGDELEIVPKLQRPFDKKQAKEVEDVVANALSSLLARAGVVFYGLHGDKARPALVHDVCVGVDVGARDRSSPGGGNDRLLWCALSDAHSPRVEWPQDIDQLGGVGGEMLSRSHLGLVLRDSLRRLDVNSPRHFLWLKDGDVSAPEWDALSAEVEDVINEGLLPPDVSFTGVEVIKSGAWRVVELPPSPQTGSQDLSTVATWSQPASGATWWIKSPGNQEGVETDQSQALLITTGTPWRHQATAEPLRLKMRTLRGKQLHEEALVDIWRLTHLNWRALRSDMSSPLPLHLAQELGKVIREGRSLRLPPW